MPKLLRPVAACFVLLLMSAVPAPAQSSDALAAAKTLMVLTKSADRFKAIMMSAMKILKPNIVENRPDVEKDYDVILPIVFERMNSRINEALDKVASIYASNFTVEELNELITFYRSPIGQKYLERLPGMTQESMLVGQEFGKDIGPELQQRIVEELRKKGHKI